MCGKRFRERSSLMIHGSCLLNGYSFHNLSLQWRHGRLAISAVSFLSQFTTFFNFFFTNFVVLWTVTFSLPVASPTIIVLSKYDVRYFKDIQGPCIWHLDFILAREGETEPLAESSYSFFYTRSVNVELDLEAGNYIVLVSEFVFCVFFLLNMCDA
jgi:hypothetical protein